MRLRGDRLSAADVREILDHPVYILIAQRLLKRRHDKLESLRTADSWETVLKIRGAIEEIDMCLQTPNDLMREAGKETK